jgi:2-polyprenyl-6-methoxyphenol hydroxylase-like FAD-dependent oxidoreductase
LYIMMYNVHETPVLIVGGGLAGLSASLFLSYHGVGSILAERHEGTSPQPKARRINLRTMELFRQIGAEDAVKEAACALADFQGMAAGPTLAEARQLPWNFPGGMPDWDAISPSLSCLCAQDLLEPVLRGLAAERGGDLRFGSEVTGIEPGADGVTATVRGPDGTPARIRAAYLIAADGARSPVRERLGIGRSGRGTLGRFVNVYFRAGLTDLVRGREFNLCQIEHPLAPGAIASLNGTDRWIFSTLVVPGRTQAEWAAVVAAVIGAPAEVEILSILEWEPGMFVADRFSQNRIFLAGDAAHVMPPYAALGANTGIQDVHNLAWKLALTLNGAGGPALLDSYHAERRPAAWFAADQSSIRTGNLREMNTVSTDGTPLADPMALTMGYQYPGGAITGDGSWSGAWSGSGEPGRCATTARPDRATGRRLRPDAASGRDNGVYALSWQRRGAAGVPGDRDGTATHPHPRAPGARLALGRFGSGGAAGRARAPGDHAGPAGARGQRQVARRRVLPARRVRRRRARADRPSRPDRLRSSRALARRADRHPDHRPRRGAPAGGHLWAGTR